MKKPRLNGCDV
jgi:NLR family CARD domain-containing protein 3